MKDMCDEIQAADNRNASGSFNFYFTEESEPRKIVAKDIKESCNKILFRNNARTQLHACATHLLDVVIAGRENLSAADVRDFRELFNSILGEL